MNMAKARHGAPLAVTHGYLGQTDAAVRGAVSITRPGEAQELQYEAERDELALFVEPITGSVIKGYERLQMNWYIEKSMIDTTRYANLFTAETDNDDVFVWPFMYVKKEPIITDADATKFIDRIYGNYDNGFHVDLLGIMLLVICAISAGVCLRCDTGKALGRQPAGDAAPQETSV